jgi:hypothetical protein
MPPVTKLGGDVIVDEIGSDARSHCIPGLPPVSEQGALADRRAERNTIRWDAEGGFH